MTAADGRVRVMFLCTGNSCRSQMAEGWARALHRATIDACSAGVSPQGLNRLAVAAMAEEGVDISAQESKGIEACEPETLDLVVTVCDGARGACPVFPGTARVVHRAFDDPPRLAAGAVTDSEALPHYRRVRDEIRAFIDRLPATLREAGVGYSLRGDTMTHDTLENAERIRANVRAGYADIAAAPKGLGCGCGAGGCCAPGSSTIAAELGYNQDELRMLPEGAEMGLGCGNPTALASLKAGETVLDLGSGGGVDVFLAAMKVGKAGRAIGVDMTAQMLGKARAGIGAFRERSGLDNVEFRLGEIEHLPVEDATVDVVISNCVINLSPDKAQVWREIGRVLRPGGRVAVSDVVLLRSLPEDVLAMMESWVGCVAGACTIDEIHTMAIGAGLGGVRVEPKPQYIRSLEEAQDPLYRRIMDALPAGASLREYVASANISAFKPGA